MRIGHNQMTSDKNVRERAMKKRNNNCNRYLCVFDVAADAFIDFMMIHICVFTYIQVSSHLVCILCDVETGKMLILCILKLTFTFWFIVECIIIIIFDGLMSISSGNKNCILNQCVASNVQPHNHNNHIVVDKKRFVIDSFVWISKTFTICFYHSKISTHSKYCCEDHRQC